ncbi:MAG: hypothetical protein LQ346_001414 [Caloplaca aetnensis]|nr:MAG: hypothetical protein LQ346_001414 [Caloplaca aetnensis]
MTKERPPLEGEALSPRSANIQMKPKTIQRKVVEQEAMKFSRPKDHASQPPALVIQPVETPGGLTVQYSIGQVLGKGGFAICYEGQQRGRHGGKIYALKVVKATMAQKKMEDKFRTELQIHAKMQHPNIVDFHNAFTFKENTYVVLELCPNGSIQEMVRNRRGISLPEVRRFVVQLCGAIKYMHARNVIHRDLKMGNLFLDKDLNVKIGDFGLAAVLVSPGEHEGSYTKAMSRRTTLCGTPNYIAPEILDKGKRGHDLKVDIWALGCIIFAMICCRPPFQANSSSEIYEKAKAVDYQWPEDKTVRSRVPEEVKNLVAALLKPDPEDRLSLDGVVNHPFFSMHGGDCIPALLDPKSKDAKPDWLSTAEPRGDVMNVDAPRLKLRDLAESCGVGYPHRGSHAFDVVGGDVDISLYKACLAEETAGTCPRVPLPNDIVYNGKTSPEARSFIRDSETPPVPSIPQPLRNKTQDRLETLPEDENADPAEGMALRKSTTQTLTARSRNTQARSTASRASTRTVPDVAEPESKARVSRPPGQASESASMRVPQGLMHERPVRMTRTLPRNTSRVTRSQKTGIPKDDAIPIYDEEAKIMSPRLTRDQIIDQLSPNPEAKRREIALRGKARIAANLQNELNALNPDENRPAQTKFPSRSRRGPKPVGWLVAPKDKIDELPETTAKTVYARLQQLQHELGLAIDHAGERSVHEADLDGADKPEATPPLITKWVDYTNKLGVGYTLDNGSMGCLLKANESYDNPQCGVLVARTRTHYQKRTDPSYTEVDQIVPQDGAPVEFSEISEESGISRVLVPAVRFKTTSRTEGGGAKMRVSRDIHEVEKRRRLGIWSRFAEYMVQNLAVDAFTEAKPTGNGEYQPGRFLRFYQRLGNVSIWAFVDGAFQFNFPDHTKLILYGDGKWIDFYYLPPAMLKRLKSGRPLDQQMLDGRKKLGYSPATFVRLCSSDGATAETEVLKTIVQVNEMQSKISFVKDVVDIWVRAGGLGKLGEHEYVKWNGFQAKKGLAWVSVGASGGDIYYKWPSAKE